MATESLHKVIGPPIQDRKGSDNRVTNALSRFPLSDASCNAVSVSVPTWIQQVFDSYAVDPFALDLIAKLSLDPLAVPQYSLQDGLLRYKGCIWIGGRNCWQQFMPVRLVATPLFPSRCAGPNKYLPSMDRSRSCTSLFLLVRFVSRRRLNHLSRKN